MKVILLFDNDNLIDSCYREYTLLDSIDEGVNRGERVSITFCHPDKGKSDEVFLAKLVEEADI